VAAEWLKILPVFSRPPFSNPRLPRNRNRTFGGRRHAAPPPPADASNASIMYLNLVQLAESFGVSESVVEDWIRSEGLPHVPERGRLLFDRAQVANWAAARGLTAQAGFLSPADPALTGTWQLGALLRHGGIWRDIGPSELRPTLRTIVERLPGSSAAARQLVSQKISTENGLTLAPVGGGFALPHPSARIALGRDSGTLALILLREPLRMAEPPDEIPITRLLFFIAPTPRAHLDLLGRLSRLLSRGPARDLIAAGATDDALLTAFAQADSAATLPRRDPTP
jgi:PTS system nitrogen regulatory IIA component